MVRRGILTEALLAAVALRRVDSLQRRSAAATKLLIVLVPMFTSRTQDVRWHLNGADRRLGADILSNPKRRGGGCRRSGNFVLQFTQKLADRALPPFRRTGEVGLCPAAKILPEDWVSQGIQL